MARRLIAKLLVALALASGAGLGGCVVVPYDGHHWDGGHDYPHHYYRRW